MIVTIIFLMSEDKTMVSAVLKRRNVLKPNLT